MAVWGRRARAISSAMAEYSTRRSRFQVFEVYHAHVKAHNRDGETVEETLRRLSRMPDPHEFAGPFAPEEVDRIESAIEEPNERESERLRTVLETFGAEEPSWIRRTSST